MTPDRRRQIEEIFQAALDLSPDERRRFINSKCDDAERAARRALELDDSIGEAYAALGLIHSNT